MKNYWKEKFDFNLYKKAQEKLNKEKINTVWVKEFEIEIIADYLKKHNQNIKFGICHGSRNGFEVRTFKKYLNTDVIGTDISETARNFPDMIQWDMHEVKDEWINNVDFIYSNSFDHIYDPYLCIGRWLSCLNNKGVIFLHLGPSHFGKKCGVTPGDCFGATEAEYRELVNSSGRVLDIIKFERARVVWVIGKKEA